ncbi:hypothetical protein BX600DRAFT_547154 [Xylariales sp. PMI_506]|nr:hypothetical protein BX600DRAFT_547154 [Xylariales sp. PMI_506]
MSASPARSKQPERGRQPATAEMESDHSQDSLSEEQLEESEEEEAPRPRRRRGKGRQNQQLQSQRQQEMQMQQQQQQWQMQQQQQQQQQVQQQGKSGGGSDTLKLRLDLNLEVEVTLKARIHVTLPKPTTSTIYYVLHGHATFLQYKSQKKQESRETLQSKTLMEGMELMKQISQHDTTQIEMKAMRDLEWYWRRRPYDDHRQHVPRAVIERDAERTILSEDQVVLLKLLLNDTPLWNRVWVVQELAYAPRVTLVCEDGTLEWDVLSTFLQDRPYADAFHYVFGSPRDTWKIADATTSPVIPAADQAGGTPTVSTLLDVLARFGGEKATDANDRVYGLLGLVTEVHGIAVDYTKDFVDLYQEATVAMINSLGNLDILCQNPFEAYDPSIISSTSALKLGLRSGSTMLETTMGHNRLPTWVADLETKEGPTMLFTQRKIFCSGRPGFRVPPRIVGKAITLDGCAIGVVGPILQGCNSAISDREVMVLYLSPGILLDQAEAGGERDGDDLRFPVYKFTSFI